MKKRLPPHRFTICKAKDGVIYDALKEVICFLQLADAVPEHFLVFGSVFQRRDAAMRALALYYIIRATQEQKLDLRDWLVKMAYAEIMCDARLCLEKDGTQYFVRPVGSNDPVCGSNCISFGKYERFIPTLDAYISMKHL